MRGGALRRRACAIGPLLLLCAAAVASEERVTLVPERAPPWRASRFLASLRDGAHAPRALRITTQPEGAQLELAYLREGVELRRTSGSAPLVVELPSALRTGEADRIAIRVALAGHVPRDLALAANATPPTLEIALTREPARLLSVALLEIADRARLELRASRELVFRLARSDRGWQLVLSDALLDDAFASAVAELRGATIARAGVRALGSDVILELTRARADDERELRLSQRMLPVRATSLVAIDWIPADGGHGADASVAAALATLRRSDLAACAQRFERSLRSALGEDALAVALSERGELRERATVLAVERLAALDQRGSLELLDGSRVPLAPAAERARVLAQPERVRGLLLALRALAAAFPSADERTALRAWLAPERSLAEFANALERARADEAECRASP